MRFKKVITWFVIFSFLVSPILIRVLVAINNRGTEVSLSSIPLLISFFIALIFGFIFREYKLNPFIKKRGGEIISNKFDKHKAKIIYILIFATTLFYLIFLFEKYDILLENIKQFGWKLPLWFLDV